MEKIISKSKLLLLFTLLIDLPSAVSQVKPADSARSLKEVVITNWGFSPGNNLRATGAEHKLNSTELQNHQQNSIVDVVNTVPGVRMEERSPGSYRLSMRGSLVRSPFGIRNVKVYIDDFPLTDAGGNTYLNLIDPSSIKSMVILKGPQSSILGANTGGTLLINTVNDSPVNQMEFGVGSFGTLQQSGRIERQYKSYRFSFTEGYQNSDGYRDNSALSRKYIQTTQNWDYSSKGALKLFAFYSDLSYQTPGGLTAVQVLGNPRASRPATATIPGAAEQKARIDNQTFYGGLLHKYDFNDRLQHVIALFGGVTDFENPFITNFEVRDEKSIGVRTFVKYQQAFAASSYNVQFGVESARTTSKIQNFGNEKGIRAKLIAADDLTANQHFAFFKMELDWRKRLFIELGGSLNRYGYVFESFYPAQIDQQKQNLDFQFMPKIAASYLFDKTVSGRISISKGYSPPTLAEFRASDNIINTNLKAEFGWNYEAGLSFQDSRKRLTLQGSTYYFQLQHAIVRRLTPTDQEFFINAGGTDQFGTEFQVSWLAFEATKGEWFKELRFGSSFSYSRYRFRDFQNASNDYSGNALTGVPKQTNVNNISMNFLKGIFLFAQHSFVSAIPLNDANTFYSRSYHLFDLKTGIRNVAMLKANWSFSIGINNILNRQYSLGNDLNAIGNRYYNPAATRNYFTNLSVFF